MSRSRLVRNRGRRKSNSEEIDITSLLDILTILLVFLLVNLNTSDVITNIKDGIVLPKSLSRSHNHPGVIIQVSPTEVWVGNKSVLDVDTSKDSRSFDHGGRRIVPLYNELNKIRDEAEIINKTARVDKPFSAVANLVVDETIKYDMVRKVLYTCAQAGFQKYKFIVLGKEAVGFEKQLNAN